MFNVTERLAAIELSKKAAPEDVRWLIDTIKEVSADNAKLASALDKWQNPHSEAWDAPEPKKRDS